MWSSFRHSLCLCSAASERAEQFRGWGAVPTGGNCHIHSVVSVDYFPSLWFSWSSSKWVTRLPNLSFPRVKDKFLLAFILNFRLLFLCLPDPIALNKIFSSSVVFLPFRWLLVPIILLNQVLFNQVLIFCIPPFLHDWTSWHSWPQLKILIVNFLVIFCHLLSLRLSWHWVYSMKWLLGFFCCPRTGKEIVLGGWLPYFLLSFGDGGTDEVAMSRLRWKKSKATPVNSNDLMPISFGN